MSPALSVVDESTEHGPKIAGKKSTKDKLSKTSFLGIKERDAQSVRATPNTKPSTTRRRGGITGITTMNDSI